MKTILCTDDGKKVEMTLADIKNSLDNFANRTFEIFYADDKAIYLRIIKKG